MKTFLINTELSDELDDMYQILSSNDINDENIIFCINEKLSSHIDKYSGIDKIYFERNCGSNKLLSRLLQMIDFVHILLKEKPSYIFTGSSIFKHRIFSRLLNIKHIAYFRGLLFDPKNTTGGIADKLKYSRFGFLFKYYIFNTFEADYLVTISDVNKVYLKERGINGSKIKIITPVWLKNEMISSNNLNRKVVFITQAFEWHGYKKQQEDQVSFLHKLVHWTSKQKIELLVRVHPRDNENYQDIFNNSLKFNKENYKSFLSELANNDIVVSPLSTLAFELMYLGVSVCFYSSKHLQSVYKKSYQRLHIEPIYENFTDSCNSINELKELSIKKEIFSKNSSRLDFLYEK